MSYTPTEWQTGDVITAEKLNKAEQGIKDAHDNAADISSEISTEVASWLDEHINVTEGVNIDDTLSVAGSAADAKVTGDELSDLKSSINELDGLDGGTTGQVLRKKSNKDKDFEWASVAQPTDAQVESAVEEWLDAHPEATTTVEDGSITRAKLTKSALDFVTPEMFGAVGDGATDDTAAINAAITYAIEHGLCVRFEPKTYGVIPATSIIYAHKDYRCAFLIEHSVTIDFNNATLKTLSHDVAYWSMFCIFNFNDRDGQIEIKNGKLIGDKVDGAIGSYYDSTQLVSVIDSKNVVIDNMTLLNSKGDGIGFSGSLYGDPYPYYPFEDFYMGNVVKNCTIDGSNRNGFSISKGRGIRIENCIIQNTTGLNPKLGVDLEPVYGKGNVFDVTFKNCAFNNNTNGSISGYTPDGITIENCKGDGSLYFRNCSEVKVFNSAFSSFTANGTDTLIDSCKFVGRITAQIFTTTFAYVPSILVSNSTFSQFRIGVPSTDGTHYSKVVLDNCAIKATNVPINGQLNGYYNLCDTFIVQNCTTETDGSDNPAQGLFYLRKISDVVIFKNNTIRVGGGDSFYSYVGRFGDPIARFEFVGNTVIFDQINAGTTRNAKTLFYDYKPDADSNVVIMNNVVNIEGNAITTRNVTKALFDTTTAYVHIFARNNIFRKIDKIDLSNTATIEENISNLYGDLPTSWDGDMNVFSGGTSGQFLMKNSNSNFDFAWVTIPSANGVSF